MDEFWKASKQCTRAWYIPGYLHRDTCHFHISWYQNVIRTRVTTGEQIYQGAQATCLRHPPLRHQPKNDALIFGNCESHTSSISWFWPQSSFKMSTTSRSWLSVQTNATMSTNPAIAIKPGTYLENRPWGQNSNIGNILVDRLPYYTLTTPLTFFILSPSSLVKIPSVHNVKQKFLSTFRNLTFREYWKRIKHSKGSLYSKH